MCNMQCMCHGTACTCTPAGMHAPTSHSSSSGMGALFPYAGPCFTMHTHRFFHVPASPSSLGSCSHRATHGWSPGSPPSWCHSTGWACTQTHTHMCVLRRGVTHPAAVGKAPPGRGLPRRSCWVTARPNDAMSSFAYAKQHHCCRVPREEALPPAPRDPLGCPGTPTHLPCMYPPLGPGLHGFINSNYPH